jgi:hypothetical protein
LQPLTRALIKWLKLFIYYIVRRSRSTARNACRVFLSPPIDYKIQGICRPEIISRQFAPEDSPVPACSAGVKGFEQSKYLVGIKARIR